ncbi:MAG: hypothetical protein H0X46_05040 [Bacteroidetes bacterium]|nr:hypothetical protein [Bacteroidota bacterium]
MKYKMSKIVTLILFMFASITMIHASNDKKINSVISKGLQIPAGLKSNKLDEKVNVQFQIANNGKATVLNVETANPELKNYILNQFPKIDFNNVEGKQEGVYFIDINFKVL